MSDAGELAVHAENLTKVYRLGKKSSPESGNSFLPWRRRRANGDRDLVALDDVSLEVRRGEALGVIGSNGAGKSTLLKILGRITPPTRGRATIRGRVVPLIELGRAFQPEATGRENLFLNAALYGIPRSVVLGRLDDVVQFAELEEFIDEPVKRYSSGMYARLAFSVAVNMDPDILLADEILAVGDLDFQQRCLDRIREAGSLGTTVLFVSHDMAMVKQMCDRVVWLREGRIAADGDPAEVISAYEGAARAHTKERTKAKAAAAPEVSAKEPAARDEAEHGAILRVRALDATGREVERVPLDGETSVEVTFELLRGGVDLRCVLVFRTEAGDAFRSPQPTAIPYEKPGVYTLRATIPPNLLNDTTYTLKVGLALESEEPGTAIVRRDALSFEAYEPERGSATRGTYAHPLGGAVRPLLAWHDVEPGGAE